MTAGSVLPERRYGSFFRILTPEKFSKKTGCNVLIDGLQVADCMEMISAPDSKSSDLISSTNPQAFASSGLRFVRSSIFFFTQKTEYDMRYELGCPRSIIQPR